MLIRKLALTTLTALTLGFSSLPASANHEATIGKPCYSEVAEMEGTIQGIEGWCIPEQVATYYSAKYQGEMYTIYQEAMGRGLEAMKKGFLEEDIALLELGNRNFKLANDALNAIPHVEGSEECSFINAAQADVRRAAKASNNAIYAAQNNGDAYVEWAKVSGETSMFGGWD